jgi:hypothetical protein
VAGGIWARWRGLTVTWERAAQVGGLLVLLVLGAVLPYVTMEHYNARTELAQSTARLFGAAEVLNGIDPSYMPSYDVAVRSQMNLAFNVIGFAPGLQEIGTLVAAATCWGCSSTRSTSSFGGRCTCPATCLWSCRSPCSSACTCCGPVGLWSAPVRHGCPPFSQDSSSS